MQGERRNDHPLLPAAQLDGRAVAHHLDRPEDPDPHDLTVPVIWASSIQPAGQCPGAGWPVWNSPVWRR
jgi:hypothetical protein